MLDSRVGGVNAPRAPRRTNGTDADSVPVLMSAMTVAASRDLPAFTALIEQARTHLRARTHKAHSTLNQALTWAADSEWDAAWGACHQAMCDLTWTFPPDISLCPPPPSAPARTCTSCSQALPSSARFCFACGTATLSTPHLED